MLLVSTVYCYKMKTYTRAIIRKSIFICSPSHEHKTVNINCTNLHLNSSSSRVLGEILAETSNSLLVLLLGLDSDLPKILTPKYSCPTAASGIKLHVGAIRQSKYDSFNVFVYYSHDKLYSLLISCF